MSYGAFADGDGSHRLAGVRGSGIYDNSMQQNIAIIADGITRLVGEYVEPHSLLRDKGILALAQDSGGNDFRVYDNQDFKVRRVVFQCFSGKFDVLLGGSGQNAKGQYSVLPDLQIVAGVLFSLAWNGDPMSITLRNPDGANTAQYSIIIEGGS